MTSNERKGWSSRLRRWMAALSLWLFSVYAFFDASDMQYKVEAAVFVGATSIAICYILWRNHEARIKREAIYRRFIERCWKEAQHSREEN